MLRIYIDEPLHGWIRLTLEAEDQIFVMTPSHIPFDSISSLVEAPLSFAQWGEGRGRLNTEPITYEIVLRREGEKAVFEVFELPEYNSSINKGILVFKTEDAPQALLLTFWRALRNLKSRFDRAQWNYDFPTKDVERLGQIVKGNNI